MLTRKQRAMKTGVMIFALCILLQACATYQAQQRLNTWQNQVFTLASALEPMRLKLKERCANAPDTLRKVLARPAILDSARRIVDYLNQIEPVKLYMKQHNAAMEDALVVLGDIVEPVALPRETDAFDGCTIRAGRPLDQPVTFGGPSPANAADNWVFQWAPSAKEGTQIANDVLDKYLPQDQRMSEIYWLSNSMKALGDALDEQADKGEITLLQRIRANNAGVKFLFGQALQQFTQLRQNLAQAQVQDQAAVQAIADGLAAVATAAMVVAISAAEIRQANANAALARTLQLQAMQPPRITCTVYRPGYGWPDQIICR